ncbi:O-antigen ligase family protein [Aquisalimonas sp.]|uniref:O-antigen ligase family protein n=1 Tax=Aquisalimonas sp. TaxID=1872621 RepID=UPI0025BB38F4|nr:O-antigen ligase family protein [Aquisalimonas sp.]
MTADQQTLAGRAHYWIGALGLVILALGVGPSSAAISIGYAFLLLFLMLSGPRLVTLWQAGWESKVFVLLCVYVPVQGLALAWLRPELAFSSNDVQHVLRTVALGTIAVGWAVYATRLSPRMIAVFAAAGFALATLEAFLEHGPALFEIRRMHYLRSPNEVGLFGGTIALGAFFLGGSSVLSYVRDQAWWRAGVIGGIALLCLIAGLWLWVQSGSRSTWVGMSAAVLVMTTLALAALVANRQHVKQILLGVTAAAVVLGSVATYFHDDLASRMDRELPTLAVIASGDFETLLEGRGEGHNPRFKIWGVAIDEIGERPWVGLGSGFVEAGFADAEDRGVLRGGRDHYHNLYLHLAVFIGGPAVLLWVVALAAMAIRGCRPLDTSAPDVGLRWFLLAWLVFLAVTSLFQVRMHSAYGAAYFALFSGLIFGLYLKQRNSGVARP